MQSASRAGLGLGVLQTARGAHFVCARTVGRRGDDVSQASRKWDARHRRAPHLAYVTLPFPAAHLPPDKRGAGLRGVVCSRSGAHAGVAVDPAGGDRDLTSVLKQDIHAERILGRERFGKARRVRSGRDFQRVRRRGRHVSGQYLSLSYARRPAAESTTPLRAGFTVGKRVGGAVVRNQVKRRLREIVRRSQAVLAPGWDVILNARPTAAGATYADLEAETHTLFRRAGLWVDPQAGMPSAAETGPSNAETIRGEL